jgi:C_GCAxxG_C_C family probable redox protein
MTETKVEQAVQLFSEGMLCSQAMLLTYGPQFGIDEETAIRVSRPFGSGIARMCETCGAVSGAYMVLGLRCQDEDEKAAKEKTYILCRELAKRFSAANGSTNCYELLQCDLGTPEGQSRFREQQLVSRCRAYVRNSAEILESILLEKEN